MGQAAGARLGRMERRERQRQVWGGTGMVLWAPGQALGSVSSEVTRGGLHTTQPHHTGRAAPTGDCGHSSTVLFLPPVDP